MNKDQRIQALIDAKRFTEADKVWLTTVPEDRLSALEAVVPEPKKEEPVVAEVKPEVKPEAALSPEPSAPFRSPRARGR